MSIETSFFRLIAPLSERLQTPYDAWTLFQPMVPSSVSDPGLVWKQMRVEYQDQRSLDPGGGPGTCGAATAMAATPKIQLQLGHSLDPLFDCTPFDSKWTTQQI